MSLKSAISIGTIAVFIALVAVFVGYVASLGIRVSPPSQRTNLSVAVNDINNIAVDSNVLLRGVPVGKVTDIDASVENATIRFYVNGDHKVPIDSDVRLENLSALGESYIELEPHSTGGPYFADGQQIPSQALKTPPSISELGASVVRVLNQADPQQLSRVVAEADAALPDPNAVLPNLARASLLLRNTAADMKGQGRALLDNFQVLLQNAAFVGPAIAKGAPAVRTLGQELHIVWNDAWAVAMSVIAPDMTQLSSLVNRIQTFLDDRAIDLKVLGTATSENVKLIANALKNFDSSQILANLLATVPEDGAVELHVAVPQG